MTTIPSEGLDRIEVGKQYRYVPRPAEMPPCPECGHTMGVTSEFGGHVVVVIRRIVGDVHCRKCLTPIHGGGYYWIAASSREGAAPYTFLQPLEPSGPEPRGG